MGRLLEKARQAVYEWAPSTYPTRHGSRNTQSDYLISAPHQYGQPPPQSASIDAQALITDQRKREIVERVGTPAACLNATLDYASNVALDIRSVDASQKADPARVAFVKQIMRRPNGNDDGLEFKQKLIRDLFVLGQTGIEIEKGEDGTFANLNVVDASRLRLDFDEAGKLLGYNMIDIHGQPTSRDGDSPYAWLPDELIYMRRDPMTTSNYGASRVSQLFTYAIIEDLIHHYISQRFTDSNIPRGVYDLGEITPQELQQAVASWNTQVDSAHKIVITGSRQGGKWYPMNYNLKDLEAPSLIEKIQAKIMAIVGVTKNELGDSQDVSKSNGYNLSFTFKKRAIEPILNAIVEKLTTRLLWDVFGFTELEFYYHEIDSRDEMIVEEIDTGYMKLGVLSLDQIRNRRGDASVPGGDECNVFTGSAWIPSDLVRPFAEMQLAAMEAEVAMLNMQMQQLAAGTPANPATGAPATSGVEMPVMRFAGPMEKFTTPGGAGSSSFKFKAPKPQVPTSGPQLARGPKKTMQGQGLRSEQLHGK